MKINETKKMIIVFILVVLITLVISFLVRKVIINEATDNITNYEINELISDFGSSSFDMEKFIEETNSSNYADEYILSRDSWIFSSYDPTPYESVLDDLFVVYEETFSIVPNISMVYSESFYDTDLISDSGEEDITYYMEIYQYSGVNLFRLEYDIWELSAIISYDYTGEVDAYADDPEFVTNRMLETRILAIEILLQYPERYIGLESWTFTITYDEDMNITNPETVYLQMAGDGCPELLDEGESVYGDSFVASERLELEEIYEKAIEDGLYSKTDLDNFADRLE